MDTDKLAVLRCPILVDFNFRWRKTGLPGEKRSKHRRDQLRGTLSREASPTRLGFSVERHNALTACVTRASLNF